MEFKDLSDLSGRSACDLGETPWQKITTDHVQAFADLTGDHQWIHLDPGRAKAEGPFEGAIVHGAFVMALAPVMVGELFRVSKTSHMINAGVEKARLRQHVPVGARIRGRATLLDAEPFADGVLANIALTIDIEGQKRPACTLQQRMIVHA